MARYENITLYQINTYEDGRIKYMSKTNRGKPHAIKLFNNAVKRTRELKRNGRIDSGVVTLESSNGVTKKKTRI